MPVFRLDERILFPDPELADDTGLLAVGGDLSPERLLLAYSEGVFPWYNEGLPILWHCPDPRMVLTISGYHRSRSLTKFMRKANYEVRFDTVFPEVIRSCAEASRKDQDGTWITDEMVDAYIALHELGFAHSAEAWDGDELAGGLYGVSLGKVFFGESMFTHKANGSKVAFDALVDRLREWDFELIDCQVHTEHLASLGAEEWPRSRFLSSLSLALEAATRRGSWAD